MMQHGVTINGIQFDRKSEKHTYTHAVVARYKEGIQYKAGIKGGDWVVVGWRGSLELAEKERRACLTRRYSCFERAEVVENGACVNLP
jgi:hypothetical protein